MYITYEASTGIGSYAGVELTQHERYSSYAANKFELHSINIGSVVGLLPVRNQPYTRTKVELYKTHRHAMESKHWLFISKKKYI